MSLLPYYIRAQQHPICFPLQVTMFDRHVHALNKVVKHYKSAFLLKDLVELFKILNICIDRVDGNECYLKPLLEMLKIVGKPFFKEKTSDESNYEQIAIESISQLGKYASCIGWSLLKSCILLEPKALISIQTI